MPKYKKPDPFDVFSSRVSSDPNENIRRNRELVEEREVVCPAGTPTHDKTIVKACFCRISQDVVSPATSPISYGRCTSQEYLECPVWRMVKDRIAKAKEAR